ncbi:MAG: beta-lactamase family protein [Myxococcales bacterium]|nr:beta-lactamase family protein [Myxococcales bacterium]
MRLLTVLLSALVGSFGCELSLPLEDADAGARDASPETDAAPVGRDGGTDAGPPDDLDGFIEHHMAAGGIPGLGAAVLRGGEIAWVGTYGFADVETGRPVDARTLFIVASISKTVVAALAMQLVEDGALDLDAPLDDLGYEMRHPDHPDAAITTRQLFAHTSGLRDNWPALARVTSEGEDDPMSLAEFGAAYVAPSGALFARGNFGDAPGARRDYCNAGFGVLGHVIERAAGAPLPALSEARLFVPLGMDGASWLLTDTDRARLATPYSWNRRQGFVATAHYGFAFYPATSLRISVLGLARFALAHLGGGALDDTRVLSEESVGELFRPQFPSLSGGQGLAWSARTTPTRRWIGHSGSTYGASTLMLLDPHEGLGLIVLTNSDAYVRSTIGFEEGTDALDAIVARLDAEVTTLGADAPPR